MGKVLATLTSLCELGLFQKMRIWELMSATLGFLYHPNVWIRQGKLPYIYSPPLKSSTENRCCGFHCGGRPSSTLERYMVYLVPVAAAFPQV